MVLTTEFNSPNEVCLGFWQTKLQNSHSQRHVYGVCAAYDAGCLCSVSLVSATCHQAYCFVSPEALFFPTQNYQFTVDGGVKFRCGFEVLSHTQSDVDDATTATHCAVCLCFAFLIHFVCFFSVLFGNCFFLLLLLFKLRVCVSYKHTRSNVFLCHFWCDAMTELRDSVIFHLNLLVKHTFFD